MLSELKAIHAELREAITELAAIVSATAPDEEALSRTRLKLTRLSRRRSALIRSADFPQPGDAAVAARLNDLRLEATELMVKSSEHITRWTTRAILADWAGYQRASAEMRKSMLRRIEREAALLYPLLEGKTHQGVI